MEIFRRLAFSDETDAPRRLWSFLRRIIQFLRSNLAPESPNVTIKYAHDKAVQHINNELHMLFGKLIANFNAP